MTALLCCFTSPNSVTTALSRGDPCWGNLVFPLTSSLNPLLFYKRMFPPTEWQVVKQPDSPFRRYKLHSVTHDPKLEPAALRLHNSTNQSRLSPSTALPFNLPGFSPQKKKNNKSQPINHSAAWHFTCLLAFHFRYSGKKRKGLAITCNFHQAASFVSHFWGKVLTTRTFHGATAKTLSLLCSIKTISRHFCCDFS